MANEACDADHVSVNGRKAKASYDVKPGDIIEIHYGDKSTRFRVCEVKEHAGKNDACEMYEMIDS